MGAAFETVTSYVTNGTGTAGTYYAAAAQSGQSLTVRATPTDLAGKMMAVFGQSSVATYMRINSARMHDQVVGTEFAIPAYSAATAPGLASGIEYEEPLWNTDILSVAFTTVATAAFTGIAAFTSYYPSLGGIQQNMMTWAQVQSYVNPANKTGLHYVSWVTPTIGGTVGVIGAGTAINAVNDQFKANHSYALLGYLTPTAVGVVQIQGTDTGNLYLGGPGSPDPAITSDYFVRLSKVNNLACIPIVQANNKGNTFVYLTDAHATSGTPAVGLIWVDLGTGVPPVGS